MATLRETEAMRLAIALSARGLGTTSPNPPVGCVVLDTAGQVVGTGYHERKGEPHAETRALAVAGIRAEGGTAVVTLEPCNHVGRTPACRQALLDATVARVVIALLDPTSRGEGGAVALRSAGVDVEVGALAEEARLVLGPWLDALKRHRPHVTVAYAVSKDGVRPVGAAQLGGLRAGADAVLYDDGHVEEGVPNSHGRGVLGLPTQPLTGSPDEQLTVLYRAGVRLLLVSSVQAGRRYTAASAVDRLLIYNSIETPAALGPAIPSGFRLSRISAGLNCALVECLPG